MSIATKLSFERSEVNTKENVMKVKVGDTVYDGELVPVMVILSDADKENIANMLPKCTKYAVFPDESPEDEIERWMGDSPNVESEVS